ncbi:hypothetical protein NA78x_002938 [Anatilimnocola sp. NA78]|uniref:hypothetical protein n=1 Tax=Anatilimnocola sp. NA78 TaxID=3415683 RepID=UPI003CE4AE9A
MAAVSERPLVLEVQSDFPELAARVAYFLATETSASVAPELSGPWQEAASLRTSIGSFDLSAAELRARQSLWRTATLDEPYPTRRTLGNEAL